MSELRIDLAKVAPIVTETLRNLLIAKRFRFVDRYGTEITMDEAEALLREAGKNIAHCLCGVDIHSTEDPT